MGRDGEGDIFISGLGCMWGQDRSRPLKFRRWDLQHDSILTACIGVVVGEGIQESLEWAVGECNLFIAYTL